jgi:hypothetical protein
VAGALIGAASGNAGAGAAIGAGGGLLVGSAAGSNAAAGGNYSMQQRYDMTYTQCMYSKGNQVQQPVQTTTVYTYHPRYYYAPPPPRGITARRRCIVRHRVRIELAHKLSPAPEPPLAGGFSYATQHGALPVLYSPPCFSEKINLRKPSIGGAPERGGPFSHSLTM